MGDEGSAMSTPLPEGKGQSAGIPQKTEHAPSSAQLPTTGHRPAFRDLRRQLTEEELKQPGVQKVILDVLEDAEVEKRRLEGFVQRFHDADKRACVLDEQLKNIRTRSVSHEILYSCFLGLGTAIMGLTPLFWYQQPQGWLTLILGTLMVIGATVSRILGR